MKDTELLKSKQFGPLFGTQFLGAFNDNIFKTTLAIVMTFNAAKWTSIPAEFLAPIIGAFFIIPFFLFSGFAGELADNNDKAALSRSVKIWEIILMVISTIGFYYHSITTLLFVVFGLGLHSTLFGPIKYSIIPQHVKEEDLVSANALIESGTFAAILIGTIAGGVVSGFNYGGICVGLIGIVISVIGYLFSRHIPAAPPVIKDKFHWNIFKQTVNALKLSFDNKIVFLAIIAISSFWLYGSMIISQFPSFVTTVLLGSENTVTIMLGVFTVGVGIGSMLCGKLSDHYIKPFLIIIGAIGITIFGIDFAITGKSFISIGALLENLYFWHLLIDLALIGIASGIFSVPLYSIIQSESDEEYRSRIIAGNNIINAFFMVMMAVITMILFKKGYSITDVFLFGSVITSILVLIVSFEILKSNKKNHLHLAK
jgi:MFS family permease